MVRLLIAAGGTGGHVYPALAVVESLRLMRELGNEPEVYFVGGVGGMELKMVTESGIAFSGYAEVRSGPLHGIGAARAAGSLAQMSLGTVQALRLLRRWRPQAILMTGGWVNVPVAVAAWLLRVPSMMYLPDIEPGLAIKTLRHIVNRVAVTVEDSRAFFREGQTVVTGYPLRQSVVNATRKQGEAFFQLKPDKRTLLVFGGSRGARTINTAVSAIAPDLLADGWQIIHVTGELDAQAVIERKQAMGMPEDYKVYSYLHHEMGMAMAAADFAICRSGASTLGELPYFGLPAILVPYPFAWRYQKVNADYLVSHGAALLMRDEDMARDLLPALRALTVADLRRMRECARELGVDGAETLALEFLRTAGQRV